MVVEGGLRWAGWAGDRRGPPPELVGQEWAAVKERADMPLEHLAQGLDWRMCVALLTLHAMADEACAGLGVALDTSDADACVYRARGREMLVRTGSMARVDPRRLRVLPKVRTPPTGRPAFSRYACVQRPGIEVALAQDPRSPPRHGPSLRARDAAAPAVAARGQGDGLSPGRGQRAETVEGPVRLLRVRARGGSRLRPPGPRAGGRPRRGRERGCRLPARERGGRG